MRGKWLIDWKLICGDVFITLKSYYHLALNQNDDFSIKVFYWILVLMVEEHCIQFTRHITNERGIMVVYDSMTRYRLAQYNPSGWSEIELSLSLSLGIMNI